MAAIFLTNKIYGGHNGLQQGCLQAFLNNIVINTKKITPMVMLLTHTVIGVNSSSKGIASNHYRLFFFACPKKEPKKDRL
jgi:hypothetical protein